VDADCAVCGRYLLSVRTDAVGDGSEGAGESAGGLATMAMVLLEDASPRDMVTGIAHARYMRQVGVKRSRGGARTGNREQGTGIQ
jgi:hypothetical protein